MIVFMAVGVAFLFGAALLSKRKHRGKTFESRLTEYFDDYNVQMDKFRK